MVLNAISSRASVRAYSNKVVDDNTVKLIIEAGIMAPSWVNVQPWHFIVVRDEEKKKLLCQAAGGQKQVQNASALICCVADMSAWDVDKFSKVMEKQGRNAAVREYILNSNILNPSRLGEYETLLRTVEQLSYAIGYMTLRAQELGVGCCIVGAVANELTHNNDGVGTSVKEALGLGEKQVLLSMLTLGYQQESNAVNKSRKEFDEVVSMETFGSRFLV